MRSAGAVPSTIAAMMRGDRKARGASRRMCRSPWASRSAISAKEPMAAEPDVVDPSPGLGDGGEQSVPAFRPHRRFGAGRMNNALPQINLGFRKSGSL